MKFSIEAEQSVIGGLLIESNRIESVLEFITSADFYSAQHKVIFSAMEDMFSLSTPIDVITVSEYMNSAGDLDRAGGLPYLIEMANNTPGAYNIRSYARIVADRAMERRIIEIGQRISELGNSDGDVDEKLNSMHAEVSNLERQSSSECTPFDVILKTRIEEIDGKFRGAIKKGLMTGFAALDERFGGLDHSDLWVLAARPSMGKTALAMNIAFNVAKSGKDVLVFSMEMSKEQLTDRLISSVARIQSGTIRSGKFEEQNWPELSSGVQKLKGLGIHIIDIAGIEINHALAIARKFARSGNLGLVVVDYLQLMTSAAAKGKRFEEVSVVSRQLKAMAKTIKCPVLALSQLNRGVESRTIKKPGLADIRESGQIEQDADIISFIYRDEYYNENSPNKGFAEVITSKFRNGEVGTDVLGTQLQYSRFVDADSSKYQHDWESEQPQKPQEKRTGFKGY